MTFGSQTLGQHVERTPNTKRAHERAWLKTVPSSPLSCNWNRRHFWICGARQSACCFAWFLLSPFCSFLFIQIMRVVSIVWLLHSVTIQMISQYNWDETGKDAVTYIVRSVRHGFVHFLKRYVEICKFWQGKWYDVLRLICSKKLVRGQLRLAHRSKDRPMCGRKQTTFGVRVLSAVWILMVDIAALRRI